ncbi:hypothetical protein [Streptomyces sp. 2A115]|uniref:hypothetical protein n=1 Tax=Streptomyces sp. 2A115 TaxID=3457439 RepID=UPI003FCF24F3
MLAALSAGSGPEREQGAAMTAEASRSVQSTAGNAAMVQLLRSGGSHRTGAGAGALSAHAGSHASRRGSGPRPASRGAAQPVQRMEASGPTTVYGPGGPLDGLDFQGNYYRFDDRHVRAKGLRDEQGNLIGISFPTQPGDAEKVTSWARKPQRTSDVEVYNVTMSGDIRAPRHTIGTAAPAPWSQRPLYIHAHASNEFFAVPVAMSDGAGATVKAVKVDGATFGRILRHHPGYREAARNTPGRDGLLMSCTSGHPMATAAPELARYMHSQGSNRTWYAPIGLGTRMDPLPGRPNASGYGSAQTWDEHGNEIPGGFVAYPPPAAHAPAYEPSQQAGYVHSGYAPMPYPSYAGNQESNPYQNAPYQNSPYPYNPYSYNPNQGPPYGNP